MGDLIGRRAELESLLEATASGAAVVSGPAGMGKSALARAVTAAYRERGAVTVWVTGTSSARTITLGAFAELAQGLDVRDFPGAAAQLVERLRSENATLLVIDDAHLLDDASAVLVHRLAAEQRVSSGLSVLITLDRGEDLPGAVRAMLEDGDHVTVALAPLGADEMTAFLATQLGAEVETATASRLMALAAGNPGALRDVVALARAQDVVGVRAGLWGWRGELEPSRSTTDLRARHVRPDPPAAGPALDALACFGALGVDELVAIAGVDAVRAATAATLVVVEKDGHRRRARFRDPLYELLVRASLTAFHRHELRTAMEQLLSVRPARRDDDRLLRARLLLERGHRDAELAGTFTEASRRARPDHELAERYARAAMECGAGFVAFDYLVDALLWQGRVDDARNVVAGIDVDDLEPEQRAYFEQRWSRMLWWIAGEAPGDPPTAQDPVLVEGPAAARARTIAMEAVRGRGAAYVDEAFDLFDDAATDAESRCWVGGALTIALGGAGRLDRALVVAEDARRTAHDLADFNYALLLSAIESRLRRLAGDLGGAEAVINRLRERLSDEPNSNRGLLELFGADVTLDRGELERAVALLRGAVAALDEVDFGGLCASARLRLAQALAFRGDTVTARTTLETALRTAPRTLELFRPEQDIAHAWVLACTGERARAAAMFGTAADDAITSDDRLSAIHALNSGVRLGDLGAARRAVVVARDVDGPFAAATAAHAGALLAQSPGALTAAGEMFAAFGARTSAADAWARAARVAERSGEHDEARTIGARARAAAGGARTPAMEFVAIDRTLTRRQAESAKLAAKGLTNREIAEQLGISVRTVESHLDEVYKRLAVDTRLGLRAYFTGEHEPR